MGQSKALGRDKSAQIELDFDLLTTLRVEETELRYTDIVIADAFTPLRCFKNIDCVYRALYELGLRAHPTQQNNDHACIDIQVGYTTLITQIAKDEPIKGVKGVKLIKRSLSRALKTLTRLNYIRTKIVAHDGTEATTYSVLQPKAAMDMLTRAGATHCRKLRGRKMQLIRAPSSKKPPAVAK